MAEKERIYSSDSDSNLDDTTNRVPVTPKAPSEIRKTLKSSLEMGLDQVSDNQQSTLGIDKLPVHPGSTVKPNHRERRSRSLSATSSDRTNSMVSKILNYAPMLSNALNITIVPADR